MSLVKVFQTADMAIGDSLVHVKVSFCRVYREYRCRIFVNGKGKPTLDYFTDDIEDAKTTALLMRNNFKSVGGE